MSENVDHAMNEGSNNIEHIICDDWNSVELLYLAASVLHSGNKNWASVSRTMKHFRGYARPPDWFAPKKCAIHYTLLTEMIEDFRKKSLNQVELDTIEELIVKHLIQMVQQDIKCEIDEIHSQKVMLEDCIEKIIDGLADNDLTFVVRNIELLENDYYKPRINQYPGSRELFLFNTINNNALHNHMHSNNIHEAREIQNQSIGASSENLAVSWNNSVNSYISRSPQQHLSVHRSQASVLASHMQKPADSPQVSTTSYLHPGQSTSPLLTSLLKNPTAGAPISHINSVILGSPKIEDASVSTESNLTLPTKHTFFNPTSTLANAAARQFVVATASAPHSGMFKLVESAESRNSVSSVSDGFAFTNSAAVSAPTLSKLLEMPPSLPGKLPPLPTVKYSGNTGFTIKSEPSVINDNDLKSTEVYAKPFENVDFKTEPNVDSKSFDKENILKIKQVVTNSGSSVSEELNQVLGSIVSQHSDSTKNTNNIQSNKKQAEMKKVDNPLSLEESNLNKSNFENSFPFQAALNEPDKFNISKAISYCETQLTKSESLNVLSKENNIETKCASMLSSSSQEISLDAFPHKINSFSSSFIPYTKDRSQELVDDKIDSSHVAYTFSSENTSDVPVHHKLTNLPSSSTSSPSSSSSSSSSEAHAHENSVQKIFLPKSDYLLKQNTKSGLASELSPDKKSRSLSLQHEIIFPMISSADNNLQPFNSASRLFSRNFQASLKEGVVTKLPSATLPSEGNIMQASSKHYVVDPISTSFITILPDNRVIKQEVDDDNFMSSSVSSYDVNQLSSLKLITSHHDETEQNLSPKFAKVSPLVKDNFCKNENYAVLNKESHNEKSSIDSINAFSDLGFNSKRRNTVIDERRFASDSSEVLEQNELPAGDSKFALSEVENVMSSQNSPQAEIEKNQSRHKKKSSALSGKNSDGTVVEDDNQSNLSSDSFKSDDKAWSEAVTPCCENEDESTVFVPENSGNSDASHNQNSFSSQLSDETSYPVQTFFNCSLNLSNKNSASNDEGNIQISKDTNMEKGRKRKMKDEEDVFLDDCFSGKKLKCSDSDSREKHFVESPSKTNKSKQIANMGLFSSNKSNEKNDHFWTDSDEQNVFSTENVQTSKEKTFDSHVINSEIDEKISEVKGILSDTELYQETTCDTDEADATTESKVEDEEAEKPAGKGLGKTQINFSQVSQKQKQSSQTSGKIGISKGSVSRGKQNIETCINTASSKPNTSSLLKQHDIENAESLSSESFSQEQSGKNVFSENEASLKEDKESYTNHWYMLQGSDPSSQSGLTMSTSESSDENSEESDDSDDHGLDSTGNTSFGMKRSKPKRDRDHQDKYKTWKKAISIVWRAASNHKYANVFLQRVTNDVAPGYHSIVNRPMDLSLIKKNIDNGTIKTTQEFQRDMMLMFQNAVMYNSSDHDVYHMAVEMQRDVNEQIQDFLATQLIIQDQVKESLPSSVRAIRNIKTQSRALPRSSSSTTGKISNS